MGARSPWKSTVCEGSFSHGWYVGGRFWRKENVADLQNVHIIASASITFRSISEVADSPNEIQYNLSFCSISNGLMKPTIASATFSLRQNRPPTYQPWLKLPSQTVLFHGLLIMCTFCRSFLVLLYFVFWSLCCLSFFDIRILIVSLWYLLTLLRTHLSLC
jgi:hypothetical protein